MSCLILVGCASFTQDSSPRFELPKYEEIKLSNGLPVILIPDNTLPYFSMVMLIRSGSAADGLRTPGEANFVSELLDKGTRKLNAMVLADRWASLGAEFTSSVGEDFTFVNCNGLSTSREELLKTFAQVLTEPSFTQGEFNRLKKRKLAQLAKVSDDPGSYANLRYNEYLYADHPYAHPSVGTRRGVQSLRRRDVIRFYFKHYRPNNATLAVVGKFDSKIREQLETHFGQWKSSPIQESKVKDIAPIENKEIRLVSREDLAQTQILLGHHGVERKNSDFLSLRVANTILGGGFASRLNQRIRDDLGLTYTVYSYFDARKERGPFTIGTFTRNEKVGEMISEIDTLYKSFVEKGVTSEELKEAKGQLRGTFPRALETPEKLALNLLLLRAYGISDDYLKNYLRNLDDVTVAQVNAAIKKHMNPEKMRVLVYGPSKKVLPQLRPLGLVEVRKHTEFSD
jgi:zinc protease